MGVTPSPVHCRTSAYEQFVWSLERLGETDAFVRAATAIAVHEIGDVPVRPVFDRIDGLAQAIRKRTPLGSTRGRIAQTHALLFDTWFTRSVSRTDPRAHYVSSALPRRAGAPATIGLVYRAVLEQLGISVSGSLLGTRLVIEVPDGGSHPLVVDVGLGGRTVDSSERLGARLHPISDRTWLLMILTGAERAFSLQSRARDAAAMRELKTALDQKRPL